MQKYTPVIAISIIVAIIAIIIIVIFIASNSSSSIVVPVATTTSTANNNTITQPKIIHTMKKATNTTEVINLGGTMYYLLCLTNTGNTSGVISAIGYNNSLSGNYVGNFYFWDALVAGMLDELGSGVTLGNSADLMTNFTDLGYSCTQNAISVLYPSGPVYSIKSSDSTTTDATSLLDYLSAIYVANGILIPPKFKYNYSGLMYPTYQTTKSTSTSWTLIPTKTIGANNSVYVSGVNIYNTQFILLKTDGTTALDASLKSKGYYVNTGVWDPTAARMADGGLAQGTLLLSPSFFPPFSLLPT